MCFRYRRAPAAGSRSRSMHKSGYSATQQASKERVAEARKVSDPNVGPDPQTHSTSYIADNDEPIARFVFDFDIGSGRKRWPQASYLPLLSQRHRE